MAARSHQQCRTARPALPRRRIAGALGAFAVVAGALAAAERAASLPPVRLLYGTRRVQIDVPRRPKEHSERLAEPSPDSHRSVPASGRSVSAPGRPALPIEVDEEPAADAFDRAGVGRWSPALPAEPADDDSESADDSSEDMASDASAATDRVTSAPLEELFLSEEDDASDPDTEQSTAATRSGAPVAGQDRMRPAPQRFAIEQPRSQPVADSRDKSTPGEWWLLTAGAQAAGTLAGLVVGLVVSLLVTLVIFRRQAGRTDSVVRVEFMQAPASAEAQGAAVRWQAACAPSQPTSDRELTVVEFADVSVPLPPPGGTWHDQRDAARREQEQAEQSMLKTIYEQNVVLRDHISALSKVA